MGAGVPQSSADTGGSLLDSRSESMLKRDCPSPTTGRSDFTAVNSLYCFMIGCLMVFVVVCMLRMDGHVEDGSASWPESHSDSKGHSSAEAEAPVACTASDSVFLLLNHIPHSHSDPLLMAVRKTSKSNGVQHLRTKLQKTEFIDSTREAKWAGLVHRKVTEKGFPALFDVHIRYLNFASLSPQPTPMPVYVNFLRDPVERALAAYYHNTTHGPSDVVRCLGKDARERSCGFSPDDTNLMTKFFCGSAPVCWCLDQRCSDSAQLQEALDLAKSNLKQQYAAVGIVEQPTESLELLEHVLPEFFRGARRFLKVPTSPQTSERPLQRRVPEGSRRRLREENGADVELYRFAKARLQRQRDECLAKGARTA